MKNLNIKCYSKYFPWCIFLSINIFVYAFTFKYIYMLLYVYIYVKAFTCKYISANVYMYVIYIWVVDMDFWEYGVSNIIFE